MMNERVLEYHHQADLRNSGLSDETIGKAGIFSACASKVGEILGFNPRGLSGLAFPYPFVNGKEGKPYIRIKPDSQPGRAAGAAKYLSPKGSQNHLYIPPGVEAVLNDTSVPLHVTEGEKKALKASQEELCCVALSGVWCWRGKNKDGKTAPIADLDMVEWKGRFVAIVFDSDSATNLSVKRAEKAFARELARRGAKVSAIRLPAEGGQKVGLDDYLVRYPVKEFLKLSKLDPLKEKKRQKREIPQSEKLVRLASDLCLFHDQFEKPYAFLDGEAVSMKSAKFKQWLARQLYTQEGKAANSDALNQALNVLEGKAVYEGSEKQLWNRVAKVDEAFWYDLGQGKAVKITPAGWELAAAPILFRRYPHQLAQGVPVSGGDPFRLFEFLNVPEEPRLLLLICIIAYFVPDIPHPILYAHGPQGSGKTVLFKAIKKVCDPSSIEALIYPRDINQLVQVLEHHHVCPLDNMSELPPWMSDILSQACTGAGFSKRQLYSDDDDIIYQIKRCICLNGINMVINKPDLMDRSVLLNLERIDPAKTREESKLWEAFDQARPEILGGIFDVLWKAMAIHPTVQLASSPRMADFAKWGYAIAQALGRSGEDFLKAYRYNISRQNEEVIQANTLAQAVLTLMSQYNDWNGTIKECWEKLFGICNADKTDPTFPKNPRTLKKHLERVKPNLNDQGVFFEFGGRTEKGYTISFRKEQNFGSVGSGKVSPIPSKGLPF